MFCVVAVLTQRFKVIMRQKHSRICDVAQTDVLLVMHDLRRSDNPTRFAALAYTTNTRKIFPAAVLPFL